MKILIAEERQSENYYQIWLDETKTVSIQVGTEVKKITEKENYYGTEVDKKTGENIKVLKEREIEVDREFPVFEEKPDPSYIQEFSWGKDIPQETCLREMKLICNELLNNMKNSNSERVNKLNLQGKTL